MTRASRSAFTLFEVVAILLVVSMGLLAVIGLFIHANRVAGRAQGLMTGMSTAISVAYDSQPFFRDATLAAQTGWQAPPVMGAGAMTFTTQGVVNGYYVVRNETSAPQDLVAGIDMRSVRVDVDVYENAGGTKVASFSTRLLRQKP